MKAFVYFNLHKKLWSIRSVETGRVVSHAKTVVLTDVTPKVSEKGRERVLREKRKNVHAGLLGTVGAVLPQDRLVIPKPITYDPYKTPHFTYVDDGSEYKGSDFVSLNAEGFHKVVAF